MDKKRTMRMQAAIDVLLEYKTGRINLKNAVKQFCGLTEFKQEDAEGYIKHMKRKNVIPIGLGCNSRSNK